MEFVGTEFTSSRSFGEQVDGEDEDGLVLAPWQQQCEVVVTLQDGERRVVVTPSTNVREVLAGAKSVIVSAFGDDVNHGEEDVQQQLCSSASNETSTIVAPKFVAGPAAAVLMWCELQSLPCKVLLLRPQRPKNVAVMYI